MKKRLSLALQKIAAAKFNSYPFISYINLTFNKQINRFAENGMQQVGKARRKNFPNNH